MPGTTQKININDLANYYENPRHAVGDSEKDTLEKLFDAVGVQYMLNLAEDIQVHGLLGNQQIVVVYSEELSKFVVYEGNRRVAAIKLLLYPDSFDFLDRPTIEKAKRLAQVGNLPSEIDCYVTDEDDAFFIMERLHSGEDKGRGTKQWTSKEKEVFKVRQSHEKNLSYLIYFYIKKYFDEFDITTIIPFTTIQRIFNNREIKREIGLDTSNESSFTPFRMQLIIDASNWIVSEAGSTGVAVTRMFNKARTIEDKLLPWIRDYINSTSANSASVQGEGHEEGDGSNTATGQNVQALPSDSNGNNSNQQDSDNFENGNNSDSSNRNSGSDGSNANSGSSRNLPYFFQGLDYSRLDPNDARTHGVSAVCRELYLFSNRRLVSQYPIASTILTRSIIEQALIYYSKTHYIQGQNHLIWERIKTITKLSSIIGHYKRNLNNYIPDAIQRQYFMSLFGNYEDNVDPLNWVIHRPADFQLDANTLIELPRKGLLALINYLISM